MAGDSLSHGGGLVGCSFSCLSIWLPKPASWRSVGTAGESIRAVPAEAEDIVPFRPHLIRGTTGNTGLGMLQYRRCISERWHQYLPRSESQSPGVKCLIAQQAAAEEKVGAVDSFRRVPHRDRILTSRGSLLAGVMTTRGCAKLSRQNFVIFSWSLAQCALCEQAGQVREPGLKEDALGRR